jgi:acyl-CoA synthetase
VLRSLSDHTRGNSGTAYVTPSRRTTWSELSALADEIAGGLQDLPLGARVGIQLPDDETVHAAFLATERAGVVGVGVGARASDAERDHLLARTGAVRMLSLDGGGDVDPSRALGVEDLWLLNSTSGTTGMPKVVTQTQARWMRFFDHAVEFGDLGPDETFMSVIPAPFGFGLWTAHVAPIVSGRPCVVLPRFDVPTMASLIEQERVTVLMCVSTQFRMLLNHPVSREVDLSSLKVMFTGGEMIPPDRAREFEDRTGAVVLSFFGSNETGALTATRHDDPRDKRLTTVGRVVPSMQMRLYDDEGAVVEGTGIPGGLGPLTCNGYWDDDEANARLYAPDGFMLMGDLVSVDDEGYVTVVGRTSDIIIRGGKNISAVEVENHVDRHPAVDAVGIVPVPDAVFGERVCAAVTLVPGASLTLDDLRAHLAESGLGKESWPEHLLVLDELPRSSGGKLAKGQLKDLAASLLSA